MKLVNLLAFVICAKSAAALIGSMMFISSLRSCLEGFAWLVGGCGLLGVISACSFLVGRSAVAVAFVGVLPLGAA